VHSRCTIASARAIAPTAGIDKQRDDDNESSGACACESSRRDSIRQPVDRPARSSACRLIASNAAPNDSRNPARRPNARGEDSPRATTLAIRTKPDR
jgi:hypothetical protein